MSETTITGNLAGDPELRSTAKGLAVANFTVIENRRKRVDGAWVDDAPLSMKCTVWGDPAEHLAASARRGHRVTVVGRLTPRTFEVEGQTRHVVELQVDEVAMSLRFVNCHPEARNAAAAPAEGGAHAIPDGPEPPF